jgi:hypothetical protein
MPKEPIDITPEDSIVPIYLEELTNEELAQRETEHNATVAADNAKAEQKAAILERLGLTEDELRVVLS